MRIVLLFFVLWLAEAEDSSQYLATDRLVQTSEVYGAAYLINSQLLLTSEPLRAKIDCFDPHKAQKESLTQNFTLADASYVFFHGTGDWSGQGEWKRNDDNEDVVSHTGDLPAQTSDVLDLSTLHLSWIERFLDTKELRKYIGSRKDKYSIVDATLRTLEKAVKNSVINLRRMYSSNLRATAAVMKNRVKSGIFDASTRELMRIRQTATAERLNSTVVLIPVVFGKGVSNSGATFRWRYFQITLQSVEPFFDKIIVAVRSIEDRDFLLRLQQQGKVRFWDILLLSLDNLSHDAHCNSETGSMKRSVLCYAKRYPDSDLALGKLLPLASLVGLRWCMEAAAATERTEQMWCPSSGLRPLHDYSSSHIRYLYFTEADQLLLLRNVPGVYQWLDDHGNKAALVPHRLLPLSSLQKRQYRMSHTLRGESGRRSRGVKSSGNVINSASFEESTERSCCMSRPERTQPSSWVPLTHPSLDLFELSGITVVLGNHIHFNKTFRVCEYGRRRQC